MRRHVAALAVLLMSGCTGLISEPGEDVGGPGSGGSSNLPPGATTKGIAPSTRLARLTHAQWQNTVRDLFHLTDLSGIATFTSDPKTAGYIFENNAEALSVDDALWQEYRVAANAVIDLVMQDQQVLSKILPPAGGDDSARARSFIEQFGQRAYRRPLTEQEIKDHLELFQNAPPLFSGAAAFDAGVRLVIQAMLQSPHFLYRIELSTDVKGDLIPLSPWELASRLSYTLWSTMPDDELFAAAGNGQLAKPEQIEAQARRMLDDPRAESTVVAFHTTMLDVDKYATKTPNTNQHPDVPATLLQSAEQETELFIKDVFTGDRGYKQLLTSNQTFVNADLAEIYGLSGSYDSQFELATLDANRRAGIFTQVGFLAVNATSADPDPIHRGAFLAKRIACIPIAAPPINIPPLPPANGKTNRETVASHTEVEGCVHCHGTMINPYGFPFENYDLFGRWRDSDNGQPIDSTSSPPIDGQPTPVVDAVDLIGKLAESESVHECYAKHWVEYGFGRNKKDEDAELIETLGALSREGGSVKDVIAKLVTNRAFVNRSVKELP